MKLNEIADNKGARQNRKRVGRGIASGTGKTAGRGVKGQKSRSGGSIRVGFEGGQSPLYRRLPMRGFTNKFMKDFTVVNVGELQHMVDSGKIKAGQSVDMASLQAIGLTKKAAKNGLKILGNGELSVKLIISAAACTASALKKVEKAGGKIDLPAVPVKVKKLTKKADR